MVQCSLLFLFNSGIHCPSQLNRRKPLCSLPRRHLYAVANVNQPVARARKRTRAIRPQQLLMTDQQTRAPATFRSNECTACSMMWYSTATCRYSPHISGILCWIVSLLTRGPHCWSDRMTTGFTRAAGLLRTESCGKSSTISANMPISIFSGRCNGFSTM